MKEFVLAGDYGQFRWACEHEQVNHRNYTYITDIHQLRGTIKPRIHLVEQYKKNPIWNDPNFESMCKSREAELVKGLVNWKPIKISDFVTTTQADSEFPSLTLDIINKAYELMKKQSAVFSTPPAPSPRINGLSISSIFCDEYAEYPDVFPKLDISTYNDDVKAEKIITVHTKYFGDLVARVPYSV
ncbi:MAG: hypothetical protein KKH61_20565 [Gammaproteobacteria bacterium]|nr:hypothetical protein [Gammaproteobacteria bacterium]